MKENIICSRILALFLTVSVCISFCTGSTVSAEENVESAGERTEQTEDGQAEKYLTGEEAGESETPQAEEQEEGQETAESPETGQETLLPEEEGAQEGQEALENQEEEQPEEQEQTEKQERKASGRASAAGLSDSRIEADSRMEAGQKVTWDCVWFGSYPQSEVTSSDSVYSTLQNADGWDSENEITVNGNRYRRMKKRDATYATSGNGYYYNWSDSTTWHYFKYEPIKWRVLKINGNQALLLSDVALDDQKYHTVSESVTWETSTIRSWLNGYSASANKQGTDYSGKNFIGSAFTSGEQSAIVTTSVVNADNIPYGTAGGNNTSDKVFFLSESEVYGNSAKPHGFVSSRSTNDEARRCKSSTYAKAMGVCSETTYDEYKDNCLWWLRSPGDNSYDIAYVSCYDYVDSGGSYVLSSDIGVRAALNLNLSSNQWSSAGTVCSDGTVNEKNSGSSSVVIPGKVTHYGMTQTEKTDAELVKEAANNFVKAENEYISAMNSTIKMGANTAKEAETIREKDQSSKQPILTLIVNDEEVSDEVMNAAYACLSDFFSEYKDATPSIGKIDISASMTSIESQIINTIRQSCQDVNVSTKYGKYVAHIKGKFLWGAFTCAITVTGNDCIYKGMVNSTLDDSGKVMASYIKVLGESGEDVLKQGLKSYLKDFAKYTCISDFTKETMNNALVNVADYLQSKNWGKKVLEYGV